MSQRDENDHHGQHACCRRCGTSPRNRAGRAISTSDDLGYLQPAVERSGGIHENAYGDPVPNAYEPAEWQGCLPEDAERALMFFDKESKLRLASTRPDIGVQIGPSSGLRRMAMRLYGGLGPVAFYEMLGAALRYADEKAFMTCVRATVDT